MPMLMIRRDGFAGVPGPFARTNRRRTRSCGRARSVDVVDHVASVDDDRLRGIRSAT